MPNLEYRKTIEDEIDWKVIDQLHSATSTFSNTSLELKKLYFVLVGIAIPSLIKLAKDNLDLSLFITIYFLTFAFWLLDSFTYFYQEKLRAKMNSLFLEIRNRNAADKSVIVDDEITLETSRKQTSRLARSLFNSSLFLYLIIFIFNSIALIAFLQEWIR